MSIFSLIQERYGTIIAEEYEKERVDLQGRAAALSRLLAVILGDDKHEADVGFEEAIEGAIYIWTYVSSRPNAGS